MTKIPYEILRVAYIKISKDLGLARENITNNPRYVNLIRGECGVIYYDVPLDTIANSITSCAKAGRKFGDWRVFGKKGPAKRINLLLLCDDCAEIVREIYGDD